jgi:hypothetical protein
MKMRRMVNMEKMMTGKCPCRMRVMIRIGTGKIEECIMIITAPEALLPVHGAYRPQDPHHHHRFLAIAHLFQISDVRFLHHLDRNLLLHQLRGVVQHQGPQLLSLLFLEASQEIIQPRMRTTRQRFEKPQRGLQCRLHYDGMNSEESKRR